MPKESSIIPELVHYTFQDLVSHQAPAPDARLGFELATGQRSEDLRVRIVGATAVGVVMERQIGPQGVEHEVSHAEQQPENRPWWAVSSDELPEGYLPYTRGHASREFLRLANTPAELEALVAALSEHNVEREQAQNVANAVAHRIIYAQPDERSVLLGSVAAHQPVRKTAATDSVLPRIARSVNIQTRMAMRHANTPEQREQLDYDLLVRQIDESGLFETRVFNNVECMVWPGVAEVLARRASEGEDIFEDLHKKDNRQRYRLVSPFVWTLLSRMETLDDRHHENLGKLKGRLFSEGNGSLPVKNLLTVSNIVTVSSNRHRPTQDQQALLHTSGAGLTDLLSCGEALFRILEATSTTRDQTDENRAYAEVLDAILQPLYQHANRHRPVTVADVCARYPDIQGDGDIVLRLRELASHQGYSAASHQYNLWRETHGSAIYHRRNRPGSGIVS